MAEKTFDEWLSALDLDFWGTAQHKIMPTQFFERLRNGEDIALLDTRSPEEVNFLALPLALHIPVNELPQRWQEVPTDRLVGVFCSSGARAAIGYAYLHLHGLDNVRILDANIADLTGEFMPGKARKLAQSR